MRDFERDREIVIKKINLFRIDDEEKFIDRRNTRGSDFILLPN